MVNCDAMNTPLDKAVITLRDDLTLQVACGSTALDVGLDAAGALGLARALLANVEAVSPWGDRADAKLIAGAHDIAYVLLGVVTTALTRSELHAADRGAAERLLLHALTAVSMLEEALQEGQPTVESWRCSLEG